MKRFFTDIRLKYLFGVYIQVTFRIRIIKLSYKIEIKFRTST